VTSASTQPTIQRVGIAGFGTIGRAVARALDNGIDGLRLQAVCSRDENKARAAAAELKVQPLICDAEALADQCDIIVDCAPKAAFERIAIAAVDRRRLLITVSGAALLEHFEIVERARANGAHIILATGALLGLDAVRAAAEGTIHSAAIVTRKPPRSLADAAVVREQGIDLSALKAPLRLFAGTAREGARLFPANVNVAAALGLAGIGPDRTRLEIWADPAFERNTHTVHVDADSARLEMKIENVPSPEHPGTGKITALSIVACLRSINAPLRVGT